MYATCKIVLLFPPVLGRNCIKKTIEGINVEDRHYAVLDASVILYTKRRRPFRPVSLMSVKMLDIRVATAI